MRSSINENHIPLLVNARKISEAKYDFTCSRAIMGGKDGVDLEVMSLLFAK